MQTFLPFSSYHESAHSLDYRRLGKQRLEAWQIIQAITNPDYGWQNHPAVNMWRGFELELAAYGQIICNAWRSRGYEDGMLERFQEFYDTWPDPIVHKPWWLGNPYFHASHRAMLYNKDPEYYDSFWGTFDMSITDYYWPTREIRWN